jgi:hypothetical protein
MHVPTYAKYIKDILGNKKTLPTTEVVQLTKECSAAILDPLREKKNDPGSPLSHVQSEPNTLSTLFVIWEQARHANVSL